MAATRLIACLIAMGIFSSIFGCNQGGGKGLFQTDEAYKQSRAKQLAMTPQTVAKLRKYGVTDQTQLRLLYCFYTNTKEKAAALAQKLLSMGYTGSYDQAARDKRQFVVSWHTSRIKMDEQTVLDWTTRMCEVGHEHDAEFNGWSTYTIVRIERDLSLEDTARILSEVLDVSLTQMIPESIKSSRPIPERRGIRGFNSDAVHPGTDHRTQSPWLVIPGGITNWMPTPLGAREELMRRSTPIMRRAPPRFKSA